jgi:branched-chain amino acid transport system ATP-binding protein
MVTDKGHPVLVCEEITKRFGGLSALKSINTSFNSGEITGIIGPNGSGKTTLFNVISGIYSPSSGKVIFKGESITGLSPHRVTIKGIARTFQNIRLFWNLSVIEHVLIGLHPRVKFMQTIVDALPGRSAKVGEKLSYELLNFVGLHRKEGLLARNLPYGEQRKLELARALATDPQILLLDEPAAGMSLKEARDLMELFFKLKQMGKTLVVIDHNMKVIMNLVDKVVVLNSGEKIAEGTAAEIQNNEAVIAAYLGEEAEA